MRVTIGEGRAEWNARHRRSKSRHDKVLAYMLLAMTLAILSTAGA